MTTRETTTETQRLGRPTYADFGDYDATLPAGTEFQVVGYDDGYRIRLADGREATVEAIR